LRPGSSISGCSPSGIANLSRLPKPVGFRIPFFSLIINSCAASHPAKRGSALSLPDVMKKLRQSRIRQIRLCAKRFCGLKLSFVVKGGADFRFEIGIPKAVQSFSFRQFLASSPVRKMNIF
jgi:hypothetical protein